MDRKKKLWIGAAATAGLLGTVALGAAGAVAGGHVFRSDDDRQALIDDAAAELGVEPSALSEALENALENRIDDAVDEGRLTEEQGEWLRSRLDASGVPFPLWGGLGHRFGDRGIALGLGLETAAEYLDLTERELRDALADGKTLGEIARDEGKSVDGLVQALVDAAKERIDEAVAAGRLSEERGEQLTRELEERITARVNDELEPRAFPLRHGFGWGGRDFGRPPSRAPPHG